jgi:hypothetical protein
LKKKVFLKKRKTLPASAMMGLSGAAQTVLAVAAISGGLQKPIQAILKILNKCKDSSNEWREEWWPTYLRRPNSGLPSREADRA